VFYAHANAAPQHYHSIPREKREREGVSPLYITKYGENQATGGNILAWDIISYRIDRFGVREYTHIGSSRATLADTIAGQLE